MSDHDGKFTPGDARTVLPGQPVGYHGSISWRTPIGICIGASTAARIPAQPDPSEVIESLPIPEPGFYWVRAFDGERWTVVEVTARADGRRFVVHHGDEGSYGAESVVEWGPKLEPPAP